MKSKKLNKMLKSGEIFEKGVLWDVRKWRKWLVKKRTCRFQKHKGNTEE